jgi:hypothetical protein
MSDDPGVAYWAAKNARWDEKPTGFLGVRRYTYEPPASNLFFGATATTYFGPTRWDCYVRLRDGKVTRTVLIRHAPSRWRGIYAALRAMEAMIGTRTLRSVSR